MLRLLKGAKLAQDDTTGDIYLVDCCDGPVKLTDARKLVSIAVTSAPTKASYVAGQTFSPAGMVVTATYDDGSTSVVTDFTCAPTGALATTDTKVTVAYRGKTAEQAITVVARAVISIAITNAPAKVTYVAGELFDPTGMMVTATYNDESTAVVIDYTYAPADALAINDTAITVTYEGKTAEQAITVVLGV